MNLSAYKSLTTEQRFFADLLVELVKQIAERQEETNDLLKTIIALDSD